MSSRARRRRRDQPRLNKSGYAAAARSTGAQTRAISPAEAQAAALGGQYTSGVPIGSYQPLPRDVPYNVPFGPLTPLPPYGIDPLRPDGRTDPRVSEYPVGWNIPGAGEKHIPWGVLRAAARTDIVQDCMRIIRTELTGLDWSIVVSEQAIATAMEQDGLRQVEAKQTLRDNLAPQIARAREFWTNPDPGEHDGFNSWLWMGLEEVLVLDAWPLYAKLTYGNDLHALWNLDGSTIKPLRDNLGRRPGGGDPAFQQILYGFPRGEFTASVGADGTVEGGRTADELIYSVRERRTHTPYGFSPVENALVRVNLWLKRADWMTKQFDTNSLPLALLELPETMRMDPTEMRRWRTAINDQLSGDLGERQRIQLGLPGGKLARFADNSELYKPEYDTYIIKLICASFQVTPAEVGFIESGGLGGASYHDGQEAIQYRKMILPWCRWLEGIFSRINVRYLGLDPAVEFRFLGLEEEDQAAADAVVLSRVQSGRMTLNEARDQAGMVPYTDMPEADEPYILARMGPQFIRGLQAQQEAQGEAVKAGAEMAKQNLQAGKLPSGKDPNTPHDQREGDDDDPTPDGDGTPSADGDSTGKPADAKLGGTKNPVKGAEKSASAAELDAFARWASKLVKAGKTARPFAFTTVDEATARALNHLVLDDAAADAASLAKATAAELRKAGGGGGGRDSGPRPEQGAGRMARVPSPRPARAENGGTHLPGRWPAY